MKKFFKLLRKIGYLIAFSLILYPVVSNYINQQHSSTIATDYDQKVSHLSEKEEAEMIKKAREYNKSLIGISSFLDPFSQGDGNQTEDDIYNNLSGHRGLAHAKMFTDLNRMEIGDVFYIKVLHHTFAYEVDQILTVEPQDTKALAIEKGKDYVTLVTCTPYAINTHRLLVRGKRIPYKEAKKKEEANAKKNIPIYIILLIGGIIAILFIYAAIRIKEVRRRKRRKKGKSYGKKK